MKRARMKPPDGRLRRSRAPRPDPGAERELADALHSFTRHAGGVAESARRLATLRWKRLQLRCVDAGFAVVAGAVLLFAALALALAAALRFVAGLDHALTLWSGEPWVGEFGAGVVVLASLYVGFRGLRGRTRRALLDAAPRPRSDGAPPEA